MTIIDNVVSDVIKPVIKDVISVPDILNTAIVWMDNSTINKTGSQFNSWSNKGTGGAAYDLDSITGTVTELTVPQIRW